MIQIDGEMNVSEYSLSARDYRRCRNGIFNAAAFIYNRIIFIDDGHLPGSFGVPFSRLKNSS